MRGYHGLAAAPGIAIGPAWVYRPAPVVVERSVVADPVAEWGRLETAFAMARTQLQALEARARQSVGSAEAEIFVAHQLFLDDDELLRSLAEMVQGRRMNAEAAVFDGFEHYAVALESLEEEYFQARAQDVRDVRQRVLRCLHGDSHADEQPKRPVIILAEDLTPSDTMQFDRSAILGIGTVKGGPTSHTAILAGALGVPAVVSAPMDLSEVIDDTLVILDGVTGEIALGPTLTQLERARERQAQWLAEHADQLAAAHQPAVTRDGQAVEVVANIGGEEDARLALEKGAEGVGLFRTEFLYLDRDSMPTETEQTRTYYAVFKVLGQRPIVVRTLDIGGDKAVSYLGLAAEPNPFLGWRAIRMIRERPDILERQLRALLLAAADTDVDLRIMLPMVGSLSEVERARAILDEVRAALSAEGHALPNLQFGIMIEVPSAALLADRLAKHVDFFSIGTNDLTQYTLAVDRTNERVAVLASPYHPAVLRLIKMTIDAAHAQGKWVGLCGELGGDVMAVPLLLGMGLDEFSMSAHAIPAVKAAIRRWQVAEARVIAERALGMSSANEVVAFLEQAQPQPAP